MVKRRDIEALRDQIVRQFRPRKIILFGSHAKDAAGVDSDVDLLVITEFEGSPIRKEIEMALGLEHRFPLDLLVRTPQDVARRCALNDFFIQEILKTGQVLYDADRRGMAAEG